MQNSKAWIPLTEQAAGILSSGGFFVTTLPASVAGRVGGKPPAAEKGKGRCGPSASAGLAPPPAHKSRLPNEVPRASEELRGPLLRARSEPPRNYSCKTRRGGVGPLTPPVITAHRVLIATVQLIKRGGDPNYDPLPLTVQCF